MKETEDLKPLLPNIIIIR